MNKISTLYEMYLTVVRTAGETAANLWLETHLDEQEIEALMRYIASRESA